jgi:DNA-binding MarR family transcriptional regulator
MVYLLDELEDRGLVRRTRNPEDRRAFLVRLTRAGEQLRQRAAGGLAEQADVLLQPLSSAERRQLIELLAKVADHWGDLRSATSDEIVGFNPGS